MGWGTICLDFLFSDIDPQLNSDLIINAGINTYESLNAVGFTYSGVIISITSSGMIQQGDLISKTPSGWKKSTLPPTDLDPDIEPGHAIALETATTGEILKALLYGVIRDPSLVLQEENQYADGDGFTNEPPAFIQCVGRKLDQADILFFDPDYSFLNIHGESGSSN